MNHEKIKELLPLYIDNSLEKKEEKIIESHLLKCKECQDKLVQYKENYDYLSSLEEIKAPTNFIELIKTKGGVNLKDEKKENKYLNLLKKVYSKPIKIPGGLASLAVIIIVVFLLGNTINLFNNQVPEEIQELRDFDINNVQYTQNTEQAEREEINMLSRTDESNTQSLLNSKSLNNDNTSGVESQRRIIHRANLSIEVRNMNKIDDIVKNISEKHDGYISDTRDWISYNDQKFVSYQLRIPSKNFIQAMNELSDENIGTVLSRSITGQDVSEEYMDIEIRLENLKIQQQRYRELFEKATEVEELLKIENELNRTRTEIERLQGRINYLDNQIEYSTITVEYREQEALSSGTPGIIKAIRNAVQEAINQVYRILILIGTLTPYIILVTVAYLIYRKKKNS